MSAKAYRSTKLGKVCEKPQYGYTASAAREPIGPKFLRITDLQDQRIDWSTVPWCEANQADLENYRLLHGDVLVARIGATTGSTSIVVTPPSSVFASYLIRLRPTQDLHPFFLYFYTKSQEFRDWIAAHKDSNLKGGVNVPVLLAAPMQLPPYEEQTNIAAVLWKMQHAIATQDCLIKATGDLKQSAMQRLFTHGLRGEPLKDTEIGPMPESWNPKPVKTCVRPYRFDRASQLPASAYKRQGKWPIIDQSQDEVAGYTDDESRLQRSQQVVIVFGDHSRTLKFVDFPFVLGADGTKPLLVDVQIDPKFLFYTLQHLEIPSKGYSRHYKYLAESVVGMPADPDEQRDIAAALATIDRKLAHHRAKRAALNDLFQTTLHQLMTAQVRVADLDIDISEVTDHVPDIGEMIEKTAESVPSCHLVDVDKVSSPAKQEDHFADAGKMIGGPRRPAIEGAT